MAFFNSAVTVLQTLVVALGAGLGIWGAINLLEGFSGKRRYSEAEKNGIDKENKQKKMGVAAYNRNSY